MENSPSWQFGPSIHRARSSRLTPSIGSLVPWRASRRNCRDTIRARINAINGMNSGDTHVCVAVAQGSVSPRVSLKHTRERKHEISKTRRELTELARGRVIGANSGVKGVPGQAGHSNRSKLKVIQSKQILYVKTEYFYLTEVKPHDLQHAHIP